MSVANATLAYLKAQAPGRLKRLEKVAREFQRTFSDKDLDLLKDHLSKKIGEALKEFGSWTLRMVTADEISIVWERHGSIVYHNAYLNLTIAKSEKHGAGFGFKDAEGLLNHLKKGLDTSAPWTSMKAAADRFLEELEQVANAVAEILEGVLEGYLNDPQRKEMERYAAMDALN